MDRHSGYTNTRHSNGHRAIVDTGNDIGIGIGIGMGIGIGIEAQAQA